MITVKAKAMVDRGIFYIPNLEKRQITEWDQPALVRLLLTVFEITVKFLIHILSLTYVSFIEQQVKLSRAVQAMTLKVKSKACKKVYF